MRDLETSKRGGLHPIWGIASQTTDDSGALLIAFNKTRQGGTAPNMYIEVNRQLQVSAKLSPSKSPGKNLDKCQGR